MSFPANQHFNNVSFNQQGGSYSNLTATTSGSALVTAGPFQADTAPRVGDMGTLKGTSGGTEYAGYYRVINGPNGAGNMDFVHV